MSSVSEALATYSTSHLMGEDRQRGEQQGPGPRFTPLLSRDAHTFSQMKAARGGPRMFSAICFPGWKKD
jgi:hypothetical protein